MKKEELLAWIEKHQFRLILGVVFVTLVLSQWIS